MLLLHALLDQQPDTLVLVEYVEGVEARYVVGVGPVDHAALVVEAAPRG